MAYNPSENAVIVLDKYSRVPIYEQVVRQLETQILTGALAADDPLPSVRSLSLQLGVNPNTLQKAFAELDRLELCYTVAGNGRFVHPDAAKQLKKSKSEELYHTLEALLYDLETAGQTKEEIIKQVETILQRIHVKETTKQEDA